MKVVKEERRLITRGTAHEQSGQSHRNNLGLNAMLSLTACFVYVLSDSMVSLLKYSK